MAKFVEVHQDGRPVLFNLDQVGAVSVGADGKTMLDFDPVDESYDEMKQLIGAAQGGIPMEPGRMYDGS